MLTEILPQNYIPKQTKRNAKKSSILRSIKNVAENILPKSRKQCSRNQFGCNHVFVYVIIFTSTIS